MKRVKIRVVGDVQGVSYRFWMKMKADGLQITGWARNEEDGSVTVVAEGEESTIKLFLTLVKEGSPMATIENVEVSDEEYAGEFKSFEVY